MFRGADYPYFCKLHIDANNGGKCYKFSDPVKSLACYFGVANSMSHLLNIHICPQHKSQFCINFSFPKSVLR